MNLIEILVLFALLLWPVLSLRSRSTSQPKSRSGSRSRSSSHPDPPGGMGASHSAEPSAMDVVVVKMMLQQGLRLPPEVILSILDFAEYWPHTTALMDRETAVRSGRDTENKFILRSHPLGLIRKTHYDRDFYAFTEASPVPLSDGGRYPLSQFQSWIGSPVHPVEHPCRKIVFTITSHDQGWSGNARHDRGSYRRSWTWFEAGLERFDRNAVRPKDSAEKDARGGGGTPAPSSGEEAEGSSSPEKRRVAPGGDDDPDLPEPYLPVYALRPVRPAPEQDGPGLHHGLLPDQQLLIQHNKTATRASTTHTIVWSWDDRTSDVTAEQLQEAGRGHGTGDGAFVRGLELGDVVTFWAKSRFGGWVNTVESVRVDIYWAL